MDWNEEGFIIILIALVVILFSVIVWQSEKTKRVEYQYRIDSLEAVIDSINGN